MDNSAMGGLLDLEPAIHQQPQHHHFAHMPPPSQLHQHHPHHMQVMGMVATLENDRLMAPPKSIPLNYGKGKGISIASLTNTVSTASATSFNGGNNNNNNNTSDEDEPSFAENGNDAHSNDAKGKKGFPWQRMKWTDNVVRLLITAVSYVGEDGPPDNSAEGPKRKTGLSQKKGKWKTVSKIMMEKGCYVSPQQCEDKFNDLNKRYKRLNEILGRGTTCQVVENPILLESMAHLSPKVKDDVKKILSSKHLFYKEMCAYHNGQKIPNSSEIDLQGRCPPRIGYSKDSDGYEEEDDGDNDDCDDDTENEDDANDVEDLEKTVDFGKRKKMSEVNLLLQPGIHDNFGIEMAGMLQDATKSPCEEHEWIRNRTLQLQEQRVSVQVQAFELEKSRFKWLRFCSKKDKELERMRLENERMRLENERIALQVKQQELEIDFKRSGASINPPATGLDKLLGRDHIDLGRIQ